MLSKQHRRLVKKSVPVAELRRFFSIGRKRAKAMGRDVQQDVMLENIKALLDDKVDGALRAVAATMPLEELQRIEKSLPMKSGKLSNLT